MFDTIKSWLKQPEVIKTKLGNGFVRAAGLTPTIQQDPALIAQALAQSLSGRMSGNRDIRETLINASRAEDQRNGYYNGMLNRVSRDRVGTGPKLRPLFDNEDWNQVLRKSFSDWIIQSKFARKLRAGVRDAARDGATLGVRYTNRRLRGPVKLDVWFTDSLRLRNPFNFGNNNELHADGIDFDQYGNPLRYYIEQNDDLATFGSLSIDPPRRYDDMDVIHYFTRKSTEQVHGIPEAASGLLMYPALRRYLTAVIHNCEQAANIVYTVSNENGFQDEYTPDPFASIPVEHNTITELPGGYRMDAFKPEQPQANHEQLINSMVNESARCFDMPLILAIGSAGNANFAAANFDTGPYLSSTKLHRQDISCDVVDEVFGWWYEEAILVEDLLPAVMRRRYPTADTIPHSWGYDRIFRHSDPQKEASAKETNLKTGVSTLISLYEDEGEDAREAIEAEAKLMGMQFEEYTRMLVAARFGAPSPQEQQLAEKQLNVQKKQAEQQAEQQQQSDNQQQSRQEQPA
jgi:capsid protein